MPIRFMLVLTVLALAASSVACRDEGSPERAAEAVDETARKAVDVGGDDARGLADAAESGGAARTANAVDRAAREAAQTVETPGGVEAVGKELSENVENSARVYDDAYDAARKQGESAIEAGGDAYDAVLEIPEEKKKLR